MSTLEEIQTLVVGKNNLNSKEIFEAREIYNEAVALRGNVSNLYSLWDVGKYYGLVDKKFNTVNLRGSMQEMINANVLKELNVPGQVSFGVNFVVDAFREFSTYYGVLADAGKLNTSTATLSSLVPTKGWVSMLDQHEQHVKEIYSMFLSRVATRKTANKINTLKDFMSHVTRFLFDVVGEFPITRTGFSRSRFVDPHVSGLLIDLSNSRADADALKFEEYYRNKNFDVYKRVADSFGFAIDGNAPWRLIAKVTSPRMHSYMAKYGYDTTDIFDTYIYQRTLHVDIPLLKKHLLKMFNAMCRSSPHTTSYSLSMKCEGPDPVVPGKLLTIKNNRTPLTMQDLESQFDIFYWIKLCYKLRLLEENLEFTEEDVCNTVGQALVMGGYNQNNLDMSKVMQYLEDKIKNRYVITRKLG